MMKRLVWLLVCLLTACGASPVATPPPTPQAIYLFFPAALQPWADKLSACAAIDPQIALYIKQITSLPSDIRPDALVLNLGQPTQTAAGDYLDQVGWEQVVVIVNQANPITQLSSDELRKVFSGQTVTWEDGSKQAIQVWVLPEGDPTRLIFDSALLPAQPLSPNARLAPNPVSMLAAIAKDAGGIGYLPQSIFEASGVASSGKVKIVNLDAPIKGELHQPVLLITRTEPAGALRDLAVCLQNTKH